jgi:hypothetical protein
MKRSDGLSGVTILLALTGLEPWEERRSIGWWRISFGHGKSYIII